MDKKQVDWLHTLVSSWVRTVTQLENGHRISCNETEELFKKPNGEIMHSD